MAYRVLILLVVGVLLTAGCAQVKAIFSRPQPPTQLPPSVQPERREIPPLLAPQVSHDQEEHLVDEANRKIQGAQRNLDSIDVQKLEADQRETYQTIYSFLDQAKTALSRKDFPRALNLAQKAQVLSDELSRSQR